MNCRSHSQATSAITNSNARIVFKKFLALWVFDGMQEFKRPWQPRSNDALNVDKASARALHRVSHSVRSFLLLPISSSASGVSESICFELILPFCWVREGKSNFLDFWHHVLYYAIIAAMDNAEIQCMWLAMNVSSIWMHLGHSCLYALTDTWHIGCSVIALPPEFCHWLCQLCSPQVSPTVNLQLLHQSVLPGASLNPRNSSFTSTSPFSSLCTYRTQIHTCSSVAVSVASSAKREKHCALLHSETIAFLNSLST